MTTAADELRTAAQTLLDLADETTDEIETNTYWHSQIVDRPHWYANGIDNALGGPAGKLAGLLSPEVTREIAAGLRTAAKHYDDGFLCCEHGPDSCSEVVAPALAVARALNGGQQR